MRLLLCEGLARWGLPHPFVTVRKSGTGRPFLPAIPALPCPPDISLSHAPGLSALALGANCRVGVDVEPLSTLFPPPLFARLFTPAELADPLADPVRLWTRKEAVLKGDGRGLTVDLAQVDALAEQVTLDGVTWQLRDVPAGAEHVCSVAVDREDFVLEVKRRG